MCYSTKNFFIDGGLAAAVGSKCQIGANSGRRYELALTQRMCVWEVIPIAFLMFFFTIFLLAFFLEIIA
jgi:hypothetical protein